MKPASGSTKLLGVGAAARAACCAWPILGMLGAIGLGTAAGWALFGTSALCAGAALVGLVFVCRRRRLTAGATAGEPVAIDLQVRR